MYEFLTMLVNINRGFIKNMMGTSKVITKQTTMDLFQCHNHIIEFNIDGVLKNTNKILYQSDVFEFQKNSFCN